jgi:hypothetical protein
VEKFGCHKRAERLVLRRTPGVRLRCMSPFLALLGPRERSDSSPQSGPKRALIRSLSPIAIL